MNYFLKKCLSAGGVYNAIRHISTFSVIWGYFSRENMIDASCKMFALLEDEKS